MTRARHAPDRGKQAAGGAVSEGERMVPHSPKSQWARDLPDGPPMRTDLARLVDLEGGRDSVENDIFEAANDPQFVSKETAQRRFRSQLRRRLRHLRSKTRGTATSGYESSDEAL